MDTQSLTTQDATGLLSLIGLIALFVGLLFLVRHMQRKRQEQSPVSPPLAAKPFPQGSNYSNRFTSFTQAKLPERQVALRQAFEQWQAVYLLRGLDGNSEFLRGETLKRGLRYQLTNTSLAQGLALFIQTQMAQDGDDSRARFERLLAHLLAHPALDHPALSSWLCMPDLPTSPRLEPDLHAEAWILCVLLAAKQQWGGLERFDLDQIFQERSQALLVALKSDPKDQNAVFSSLLLRVIAQQMPDPLWRAHTEADWQALMPHLGEEDGLPGRQQALSLLQIGLEGLLFPDDGFTEKARLAFSQLERALSDQEPLEGEVEEGFSRLASFSCCIPLAMPDKNEDQMGKLWSRLLEAQPAKQDSLGASLRLITMMCMAGTLWLGENGTEPPSITLE